MLAQREVSKEWQTVSSRSKRIQRSALSLIALATSSSPHRPVTSKQHDKCQTTKNCFTSPCTRQSAKTSPMNVGKPKAGGEGLTRVKWSTRNVLWRILGLLLRLCREVPCPQLHHSPCGEQQLKLDHRTAKRLRWATAVLAFHERLDLMETAKEACCSGLH